MFEELTRKQMKLEFHREISKLSIPKAQYLSLFICAYFAINVKKRPHNHIFHGYKVFILLFSIAPACVWAVDPEKGRSVIG